MEFWLLFTILSYFFISITVSIDKHFMNKKHSPLCINTFKMFFNGIILLIIGLLFFRLNLNFSLFLVSLILAIFYAAQTTIFLVAMKTKDVTTILPYKLSSEILIVFIASMFLFNEKVNMFNYMGVFLILIGIYTILSPSFKIPKLDEGIFLTFLAVVFMSGYYLLVKKFLFDIEPINLAIMMYFSTTLILLIYQLLSKRAIKSFNVKSSKIVISAFFASIGTLFLYSALAIGNASKIYPLQALVPVFTFLIAFIFLREKFYWNKLIGTIIIIFGIFLVSL